MLQSIARQLSTSEWTRDTAIDQIGASWISDGSHGFGLALLILASLNVLAAFSTIASIFYNAWVTKEWDFYPKTR